MDILAVCIIVINMNPLDDIVNHSNDFSIISYYSLNSTFSKRCQIHLILSHIQFFVAAQESKYDFQVQLSEEKICKKLFDTTIFLSCLMQPFMSSRYRHSLFPIKRTWP